MAMILFPLVTKFSFPGNCTLLPNIAPFFFLKRAIQHGIEPHTDQCWNIQEFS